MSDLCYVSDICNELLPQQYYLHLSSSVLWAVESFSLCSIDCNCCKNNNFSYIILKTSLWLSKNLVLISGACVVSSSGKNKHLCLKTDLDVQLTLLDIDKFLRTWLREHSPRGEVSLYGCTPVIQVRTQMLYFIQITTYFLCWSNCWSVDQPYSDPSPLQWVFSAWLLKHKALEQIQVLTIGLIRSPIKSYAVLPK